MNEKQNCALEIAISGHNLLLLGSAGTGKSYVVKEIAKRLRKVGKIVEITCSTGIACQVYDNASTIHQFTGIADGRHGPNEIIDVLKNNTKYDKVVQRIKRCDVLIVDECSMISSRTFDTISQACSLKNPDKLFGGIQVIFVGYFFQLPPVANPSYHDDGSYCFENSLFNSVFPHREVLNTNIRQSENNLITAINDVYSGHISAETEKYITDLARPLMIDTEESVKLFSRNDLVDDFNRQCLIDFPGPMFEYLSVDSGKCSELQKFTAPRTLWLKIGIPVILLRNLTDKLVNGLRGTVYDIDDQGPIIEFPSLKVTTRITKVKFTVFSPTLNADIAVREQYPLKPAFGLTIHKAQGMTLSRVEIDCREIFKAGQLGVALSRATTSAGLRVINFHKRCLIPPTHQVTEFMKGHKEEVLLSDLSCCRESKGTIRVEACDTLMDQPSTSCTEPDDIDITNDSTESLSLDDDFNDVIASISREEAECQNFEIPEGFELKLDDMKFHKEFTEFHKLHNKTVLNMNHRQLDLFVKKVFLKFQVFQKKLNVNENEPKAIPEKRLVEFYSQVHEFSISSEYKLNCLILFENEESFGAVHQSICYNILETIRLFYIKQKADLFKTSQRKVTKREVTNASKARVRYVAGYCIATLRKKYIKMKKTHMYSSSEEGQSLYESAKCTVSILNALKEEEQFLQASTSEPESLLDINRKQNITHGLTNVSDSLYQFFLKLTDKSLNLLVNENLLKHGKTMYNTCLEEIKTEAALYENFSNIVVKEVAGNQVEFQSVEDFVGVSMKNLLESMVLLSSQILEVYSELVAKYVSVILTI